jgi:hypothetical protein
VRRSGVVVSVVVTAYAGVPLVVGGLFVLAPVEITVQVTTLDEIGRDTA